MDEKRIDLKPCPWCGRNGATDKDNDGFWAICSNPCVDPDTSCPVRPATVMFDTEAEATAVWNTRAPILSDDRVREAAKALVNMRKTNPAAFPKRICPYMDQLKRALAGEGEQERVTVDPLQDKIALLIVKRFGSGVGVSEKLSAEIVALVRAEIGGKV